MSSLTLRYASILLAAVTLAACGKPTSQPAAQITDQSYLESPLWEDGQAEVAFYNVRRSENQYGEPENQEFVVGTYLVKHDYDPEAESKASVDAEHRVPAFKYALFYEFVSGSYQYKRSYVTNARRSDLRPMKSSFASFDWCSNQYREITIHEDGSAESLMRSDDYGNSREQFEYASNAYPPAEIPLLIRGLDFRDSDERVFHVLTENGDVIGATARFSGRDSVSTAAGNFEAERIDVHYASIVPSIVAEEADSAEVYWRATNEARSLVRLEGASGRYEMNLIEHLRSAYWEDDVYKRLDRVTTRP